MKYNNQILEELLVNFLKNEIHKTGLKKAVIGLSGGIDSAVSTYLTVKALGNENVLCCLMPYKTSSKNSLDDALLCVDDLKVRHKVIEISGMVDSYLDEIKDENITNVRKGNIMARCRMIALYDHSAAENALVIGTGNKTEILLGYTTLFGDSASAINPVGDLYKTQLIDLAKHLKIPQSIIDKKPSADLWEGQTDEAEMGFSYENVDKYLFLKIDERKSEDEIKKYGFDDEFMKKVNKMIIRNQFKRLPPVIAKVSNRTVNIDFRYNRDWNM
ncbi:MAG TPA: NAD+ synthase [Ignavibacteria bacterium]|nr:NAD+ synthase [Ignavibacteria bacterium]